MKPNLQKLRLPFYLLCLIVAFIPSGMQGQTGFCSGFQMALGGLLHDRAYDIAATNNNAFFVAGISNSFSTNDQLLVSKLTETGVLLWSKTYGGTRDESVRKITPTADGGLLVVGQTKSYSNINGDILCLKIDGDGNLLWSRVFGLGSPFGDLGMDIIETNDGGYALSGVINVVGKQADLLVMKLNNAADPVWSKRFDRGDGEDGVGILEKGDTLIIASDLQNTNGHYELNLMKLKIDNGAFIMSKKLKPAQWGLFNPYLYKNPAGPGYLVSGHTIDRDFYHQMNHTILNLTEDFEVVSTKLIVPPVTTNNTFTGFVPMADGSFIGCASPLNDVDAYVYRIRADNTVQFSYRLKNENRRRFYRLAVMNEKILAAGGTGAGWGEDFFIAALRADGNTYTSCDVEEVPLQIEQPSYSVSSFIWPAIADVTFTNYANILPAAPATTQTLNLCKKFSELDFVYQQWACDPKLVYFKTFVNGYQQYQWDYGNGTSASYFEKYGTYNVKLTAVDSDGCKDSVVKKININVEEGRIIFEDTSVCKGENVILRPRVNHLGNCWQADGAPDISDYYPFFTADADKTYRFTAEVEGKNLVVNPHFSEGNTGFTSDFGYYPATGVQEGTYTVASNATNWNPAFAACETQRGSGGNMLLVNGTLGEPKIAWSQTISVQPNTNYGFSVYCHTFAQEHTTLRLRINGIAIGERANLSVDKCVWHKPRATWNSGEKTTAVIEIECFKMSDEGNDFALDDIFFGPITMQTARGEVHVLEKPLLSLTKDTAICPGAAVNLKAESNLPVQYQWGPASGLSDASTAQPVATPTVATTYVVTATGTNGCAAKDSVRIAIRTAGQCGLSIAPGFTVPDTVCVNSPVAITNTSAGASNYYWNFCVANASTNPDGINLGNFGFSQAVFVDYAKDGDRWYAFVTNNSPGKLVRLDFGNSLLNIPTAYDFGNLGGAVPNLCEGIQVVKNEGRWYAIIVGGSPVGRILKVDFGASLSNDAPIATNWGNIGNLAYPVDLHLFQSGDTWYGLTINADNSTITRFNFTSSFNNTPTATNLGNVGNLNYPTGIYAISKDGQWHAFVTNAGHGAGNSTNASLTRLDFGNSLLNTPTGINLGNPGNTLRSARDLTIYQSCNEIFGFVVNYSSENDIVRLNFNNSLTSVPSAISIGNTGSLSFPHCISKLFRVENDLYSFVANVNNNTITRLKFSGCNGNSIANSIAQNPDPVVYSVPGVYNINLTIDDGLPTQASVCRQVVVLSSIRSPLQTKTICEGDSVLLSSSFVTGNAWNTGSREEQIFAKTPGIYWVQSNNGGGCVNIDSFRVEVKPYPVVNLGPDISMCETDSLPLNAGNPGATYAWQNGTTNQRLTAFKEGLYYVKVTRDGCASVDSINVTTRPLPEVNVTGKTTICKDGKTDLLASGGVNFSWAPATGLTNASGATTTASPPTTTTYVITGTGENGCVGKASVTITVTPKPVFTAAASKPVLCLGDTALLTASGGDHYTWSPAVTLSAPNSRQTQAFPLTSARYKVVVEHLGCQLKDSLFVDLPVASKPSVETTKSNDINCFIGQAQLTTGGGSRYVWRPAAGLSDTTSSRPVATNNITTTYHVQITTMDGCQIEDSITVNVVKGDDGTGFPVPTAFTPNGDGKNDCFGVKYWGDVQDFSMNIYNRWGELLFHTNQPSQCWNGIHKGQKQPGDSYVYYIKAKTRCGDVVRKGTFILVR